MIYKKKGDADLEYKEEGRQDDQEAVAKVEPVHEEGAYDADRRKDYRNDRRREDRGDRGDRDDRRRPRRGEDDEDQFVEEEEVKGLTLEEFKAQQKAKQMNLKKAETRKHEEIKAKNVEAVDASKEKVASIASNMNNNAFYNAGSAKTENADLLGFQAGGDDYQDFGGERRGRGGRGGRGGFRGNDRGNFGGQDRDNFRGRDNRGARGGKKLNFNENAFPSL